MSYCCNIPEGKDASALSNSATKFLCMHCLISLKNMSEADVNPERTVDNMKTIHREADNLDEKGLELHH